VTAGAMRASPAATTRIAASILTSRHRLPWTAAGAWAVFAAWALAAAILTVTTVYHRDV